MIENINHGKVHSMSLNQRLHYALESQNLPKMKDLLNQGAELDIKHGLHFFSKKGNLEIMKYLVENYPYEEEHLINSLINAYTYSNEEIITYIIFELNLPLSKELQEKLNYTFVPQGVENITELLKKRDFNNKLKNELEVNNKINIKIKV